MPRKHLVASQTNRKQQIQAKLWQKLAREIKAAVKVAGPNPEANPRLKAAIDKALQNNLSRDSINKNINGNSRDESEMISQEYECYGPNGMQIIVSALTDNANRTASNIRGYLSKLHGEIAKPNSVKLFFKKLGFIAIEKNNDISIDSLIEWTLDFNIEDILEHEDAYIVYTDPDDFYLAKNALVQKKLNIFDSEIKLISQNLIEINDEDTMARYERFINSCDDDEDIQWVVSNVE